ncbi:hypothetical protein H109_06562 [Trichophyton interdigitale MR816]|uniref:Carrier domain-containing protein n=1 Tax=Trichophyton interdigitale (strain MR816) TaxID=1215338 RepID=A0A059J0X5_TRIIM|nr:hypothetical protein H109_06562 [Trichophyton interdigitale MR816]
MGSQDTDSDDLFDHSLSSSCSSSPPTPAAPKSSIHETNTNDSVWKWNATAPPTLNACVHELVQTRVDLAPDAIAINAWDGVLSYKQLASEAAHLARQLIDSYQVVPGEKVLVVLERGLLIPVAVLAIIQTGATFVLLDTASPESRLRQVAERTCARVTVTSQSLATLAQRLSSSVMTICKPRSEPSFIATPGTISSLCPADPSSILYVVFTSGSTGNPKGVEVSHSNFVSGLEQQSELFQLSQGSRFLHFASYSFDASVHEILITLTQGGCLCIPSDTDRMQRLSAAMNEMQVTIAQMTPTSSQLIEPDQVPTLQTLVLAGEPMSRAVIERWSPYVRLVNAYGPAECAVFSTGYVVDVHSCLETGVVPIGRGYGCVTWVTDPDNVNYLTPVGEVGELLIEGPNVSAGYLADPEKTAASFIEDPKWLIEGSPFASLEGRHARLYKTGDLVRYIGDGDLVFVGRKDTQVKLHGQRIELEEVEHQMQNFLSGEKAIAEVIQRGGQNKAAQLVAFIEVPERELESSRERFTQEVSGGLDPIFRAVDAEFQQLEERLLSALTERLPSYMVPSVCLPVARFPETPSGKLDRKYLREAGRELLDVLLQKRVSNNPSQPSWKPEQAIMRGLWSLNLGIDEDEICLDDHYFRLGGDSVSAIKLSVAARRRNVSLDVKDILGHPTLLDMATRMREYEKTDGQTDLMVSFSLIPKEDVPSVIEEAAKACQISEAQVQDIYPCTPLQEGLMALSERQPGQYITCEVLKVHPRTDLTRLCAAWATAFNLNAIMRTRIVQTSAGLVQIVVRHDLDFASCDTIGACSSDNVEFGLGSPLTRLRVVQSSSQSESSYIVLLAHHAVCDGWQARAVANQVEEIYEGRYSASPPGFNTFVRYLSRVDKDKETEYWQRALSNGNVASHFPTIPPGKTAGWANQTQHREIWVDLESAERNTEYTLSTYIRLAWAFLTSKYTTSDTVVFGATVTGRNAPVPGINDIVGPTIATVPLKVHLDKNSTVRACLKAMHQQAVEMIPYEHTGLQRIRKLGEEAEAACDVHALLIVQPTPTAQDPMAPQNRVEDEEGFLLTFSNYPLVVECTLPGPGTGLGVRVAFNDQITDMEHINRMLLHLEHVLKELSCNPDRELRDIDIIIPQEVEQLQAWNSPLPQSQDRCIYDLIWEQLASQPSAEVVYAWDKSLTAESLAHFSLRLTGYLQSLAIGPEDYVPLFFDKSSLTIISILAILTSGGACVTLDRKQPDQRLIEIVRQTGAKYMLVSEKHKGMLEIDGVTQIVISYAELEKMPLPSHGEIFSTPRARPENPAFLIFTSGSTGKPKGIILEHRNLSSATLAHAANMNIVCGARVLQYASPSFDVSVYEILMTLAMGGCLCVPSDYQRMNTPSEFAREAKAEVMIISPTAIRSMSPDEVPSLKTVVLVGEAIPRDVVETWSRSSFVMNGYGPGECTFCSTTLIDTQKWDLATVGRAGGCVFWLTDPTEYNLLAPIGAVGEILIEGPVVGRGYLNDPERTAASFINDAKWLGLFRENGRGRLYRSGDLGRYNPDGSVVYMGRRDMQVKLRGQRIEMGEVEFNLQRLLPSATVIVEVVKYGENERVTAFLALSQMEASATVTTTKSPSSILLPPTRRVVQAAQLSADLSRVLPSYMIPSVYLPLARVPTTSSGKIDRKALKHAANSVSLVDIMAYGKEQSSTTEPSTTAELALQKAWASLLKISPDAIKRETDFFQAGADSVEAMKLVSMARREGRTLNVAQIFASPQLCDMALWWNSQRDNDDDALEKEWPAFALLDDLETETFIQLHICEPHSIPREKIKDVYPATYDQVLVYSINHTVYAHFEVDERLDRARIVESWLQVVRQHDILRTVLVPAGNDQYWAVVRTGDVFDVDYRMIGHDSELHQIIDTDHASGLHPGSFLGKLFVLEYANNGKAVIILKMNHTIFDGSCFALYWSDWQSAFERGVVPARLKYQDVLCSRRRIDSYAAARQYWEDMLHGLEMQSLPTISEDSTPERIGDPLRISRCLTHISPPAEAVLDSFIKAVWAVTLASISGKRDIGFYHISNGRRLGGRRTEEAAGPLMQLYPMRAQLQSDWRLVDLCRFLQEQDMRSLPFELLTTAELCELAGCSDTFSGTLLDHVKDDIESRLSFDGIQCSLSMDWRGENQDENTCFVRSKGDQLEVTLFTSWNVHKAVAEEVMDIYCDKLRYFSSHPEASVFW